MSKEIKLASCLFLLLVTRVAFGCTMISHAIMQFDSEEYILTGEVVGFIGPQKLNSVEGEAWAVLVKKSESVHSPKTPVGYFEVFTFDLESDCSLLGRSKERLSKDYRLGAKVLVIAKESKFDAASAGNVRLVINPASNGLLSTIGSHEDQAPATSVYDYRTHTKAPIVVQIFEMRKDLLRLKQASSEEEKAKILRRLVYFPNINSFIYEMIVELHLKDKGIATQLVAEREGWKHRQEKAEPDAIDNPSFICGYPPLRQVRRGLSKDEIVKILGPATKEIDKSRTPYDFNQGVYEERIKEGWIYEVKDWTGTIEVYFDESGKVLRSNCGAG